MSKRWMRQCAVALSMGSLTACGMLGGERHDPPPAPVARPVTLVGATGAIVTVDDDRSGSPVDLRSDQQLVVRLHYEGMSAAQWELMDFTPGVLAQPGPSRFSNQNGYSELLEGEQIWRFTPARAGQVVLNFAYRPPRSREPATRTATFSVTVR